MNLEEISFLIILGVLVAFYIMFIRPATKEQNRQQQTIRDLRVGDEVETTAGFLGTIKEIDTPDEGPVRLVIDFGHGVQIPARTTSIIRRLSSAEERGQAKQTEAAPHHGAQS